MAQGEYEQGMRVGLAIKMAHEAALQFGQNGQQYAEILVNLTPTLVDHVVETQAKYLVTEAFPGATALPPTGPQSGVPMQPLPAQQSGPPPVPNTSSGGDWKAQKAEANWQLFFQDTTAWEDLRDKKALGQIKPGNPDFRHRTQKDGDFKIGVWIKDAPPWAVERLRQMGVQV